jgi:hypothetical protein
MASKSEVEKALMALTNKQGTESATLDHIQEVVTGPQSDGM